jgi:hypothetical protein
VWEGGWFGEELQAFAALATQFYPWEPGRINP